MMNFIALLLGMILCHVVIRLFGPSASLYLSSALGLMVVGAIIGRIVRRYLGQS